MTNFDKGNEGVRAAWQVGGRAEMTIVTIVAALFATAQVWVPLLIMNVFDPD